MSSVSPGRTMRRNCTLLIRVATGALPGSITDVLAINTAPACIAASSCSTPGKTGKLVDRHEETLHRQQRSDIASGGAGCRQQGESDEFARAMADARQPHRPSVARSRRERIASAARAGLWSGSLGMRLSGSADGMQNPPVQIGRAHV